MSRIVRGWPQEDRRKAAERLAARLVAGETQKQAERGAVSDVQARRTNNQGLYRSHQPKARSEAAMTSPIVKKVYSRYGKQIS